MAGDVFDRALYNELWNWLQSTAAREDAADRRAAESSRAQEAILRVHEAGWKLVADAVGKGLREIADAIREHGRR